MADLVLFTDGLPKSTGFPTNPDLSGVIDVMESETTLKIVSTKSRLGYVVINKTEFDQTKHQLYDPNTTQQPKPALNLAEIFKMEEDET